MVGALSGGMLLLAACGGANTPAAAPAATSAAVVAATAGPTIAAVATTAAVVAPTVAAVATSAAPTISAAATAVAPVVAAADPTVAALATTVAAAVAPAAPATGQTVSFKTDVLPIFTANCVSCHGASSGFSAASYADVMKGGRNGQDVKPGDADGSLLVQKVKGTQTIGGRMPRGGGPLPDADIKKISDWVAQGAKDN